MQILANSFRFFFRDLELESDLELPTPNSSESCFDRRNHSWAGQEQASIDRGRWLNPRTTGSAQVRTLFLKLKRETGIFGILIPKNFDFNYEPEEWKMSIPIPKFVTFKFRIALERVLLESFVDPVTECSWKFPIIIKLFRNGIRYWTSVSSLFWCHSVHFWRQRLCLSTWSKISSKWTYILRQKSIGYYWAMILKWLELLANRET